MLTVFEHDDDDDDVKHSYLCLSGGRVRVRLHRRKFGEELWEEFGDFPSDGSRCVLQFIRRLPARHHVMGVDLKSGQSAMNKTRNDIISFRAA